MQKLKERVWNIFPSDRARIATPWRTQGLHGGGLATEPQNFARSSFGERFLYLIVLIIFYTFFCFSAKKCVLTIITVHLWSYLVGGTKQDYLWEAVGEVWKGQLVAAHDQGMK